MPSLNETQKRAVELKDGPVLVIAGAGTGKTKVVTERILNLIKSGVSPHSILAITFTNKAASEMRERVGNLIKNDKEINLPISIQEKPFISTFHSLGVHIIKENANLLGLHRHFTIFDRADSKKAIKDSLIEISLDPKQYDPGLILNIISKAKGNGYDCLKYKDHSTDYMVDVVSKVWERYENILKKEKALDFDDLLLKTASLLHEYQSLRKHYGNTWKYIHVDEYQDTNKVQYQIVKSIAQEHRNIFVVGDADQNIYSWRGATIENILNFEKDYPETKTIILEKNYRSTKTILLAANNIIGKNRLRKEKVLYTDNDVGEKISLITSYSEADEARDIAETVRTLIEKDIPAENIAILYRTNFQSRALEEAFIKKNLPYQMIGIKFFERKEIKDTLSYLKAAINRDSWSDINRIINTPPRGIGKVTIAKIISQNTDSLPLTMQNKINNFWQLLDKINKEIKNKKPSELIKYIIEESGIEKNLREGNSEDEERLLNIRELVTVASNYDHMPNEEGVEAFITNSALTSDQDDLKENKKAVKLMTVHASKGLEFDYVFIAGMEQDLFPFKHIDENEINESEEEEERRLFYVAITRAKKKIYLSYSIIRNIYGAQKVNTPSEFIDDIGKDLIEENIIEKPSGAKALFIDF